jgi:hypothetical protein
MHHQKRFLLAIGLILTLIVGALPAAAQGTLGYDQTVSGEITSDAYEVPFTFEGTAGDTIVIAMTATTEGLDSYLVLLGPDSGEPLASDDDGAGNLNSLIGPFVLPETGTYTILATRFMRAESDSVGTFTLSLSMVEVAPLSLGETVTVDLNDSQPFAFLSVDGQMGNLYSLSATTENAGSDFRVDVRDTANSILTQGYGGTTTPMLLDPLVLPTDGTYMIVLSRQYAAATPPSLDGALSVSLTLETIDVTPLEIGAAAISGTLDDANPTDHYAFTATQGDILRLSGSQDLAGGMFEIAIFSPEGYQINSFVPFYNNTDEFALDPLRIDTTGQYTLIARRLDETGEDLSGLVSTYTLSLAPTETPLLTTGEGMTGTFEDSNVYEKVFRYEGTAGTTLRVTMGSADGAYSPSLSVQGPSMAGTASALMSSGYGGGGGASFVLSFSSGVPGTLTYEFELPESGTYIFMVQNTNQGNPAQQSASFNLQVDELN